MQKEERRTILHMDMDAFYASVEMRDDPSLKGKPLIIGALPSERGIVATCSYEARVFGVHSGMSIKEAYRLCPQGIYMHGHYDRYRAVSEEIHQILMEYTDHIEFVALDEGYLDITGSLSLFGTAEKIGHDIKSRVHAATALTCSVGIGYNKMTAKMASEEKKPDGFFVIPSPEFFMQYMQDKSVRAIPGVGPKAEESLNKMGIRTIGQLSKVDESLLSQHFGKYGHDLYLRSHGISSSHVSSLGEGKAKSYGKEVTYQKDMTTRQEMESTLHLLSRRVSQGMIRRHLYGQTVTLKIRYPDLTRHTRALTLENPTQDAEVIYRTALYLLNKEKLKDHVRLLGISLSQLSEEPPVQLSLYDDEQGAAASSQKKEKLSQALSDLYRRYGDGIVRTGSEMESEEAVRPLDDPENVNNS